MEVVARGVNIHYETYGTGEPRLLILHGWGCDISLLSSLTSRLSPHMPVAALDFPGHGLSGTPNEPWDAKAFAGMVAEFMDITGMKGAAVMGHSHGGRVALRLAIDKPDYVSKLIVTCGAGLRRTNAAPTVKQRTYKLLRGMVDTLDKARVFGDAPKNMRERLSLKFSSDGYKATREDMRGTFKLVVAENMTDELHKVQSPTLLIWGENDTETPLWMGRVMEERIPDAGLVIFEGATHFAYLEQPDRFARIVLEFLRGGR